MTANLTEYAVAVKDEWGWNVIPAPAGGKSPIVEHRRWAEQPMSANDIQEAFDETRAYGREPRNLWAATGRVSGIVVLDCDSEEAHQQWRDRIGPDLDLAPRVRTRKGWHYYFAYPADRDPETKIPNASGDGYDIRADGGGVIVPPSIHESGHVYEWDEGRSPDDIAFPPCPQLIIWTAERGSRTEGSGASESEGNVRSSLAALLHRPPTEGSRNVWLTSVAGHLAKMIPYEDGYKALLNQINRALDDPLPQAEMNKTAESVWRTEQERDASIARVDEATGFLVGNGECMLIQCREKVDDQVVYINRQWSDFDMVAHGRMVADDGTFVAWDVAVTNVFGTTRRMILDARTLGSGDRFTTWLRGFGGAIMSPPSAWPKGVSEIDRIQRYLTAQRPPIVQAAESLGWDPRAEAFITHNGLIRAGTDLLPFETTQPDPRIAQFAKHLHYGFEVDEEEAAEALAEVLTFHDETTMAVFGAWWAMCLLKPQVEEWTSLFPIMVVEAASGSGKTTGAFGLLVRMSGNDAGQMLMTKAALRDRLSAATSAIAWVDDATTVAGLDEIVRSLTTGGTMTKKGLDNTTTVEIQLRAPLAFSGESFPWLEEKATRDRTIIVDAPNPSGRRSLKNPDRPQWDDIVEWKRRYPEPGAAMAGRLVSMALDRADQVENWLRELSDGGGRTADKIAIIRTGGRLLDSLCGTGSLWTDRVDEWADASTSSPVNGDALEREDALTVAILPLILQNTSDTYPTTINQSGIRTPAFVDEDGAIWLHCGHIQQWLAWFFRGKEKPVWMRHDANALRRQAEPVTVETKRMRVATEVGQTARDMAQATYWRLADDVSDMVLQRVRG